MIRTFLFLAIIITSVVSCKAQNDFIIDFDSLNGQWPIQLYTDSVLDPLGLWQIGKPNKTFFTSAYSPQFAIMTDTMNPYPVNVQASFIIKAKTTQFIFSSLTFYHRLETDSLLDGGFVQYSADSGLTWLDIPLYSEEDIIEIYDSVNNNYAQFWQPRWNSNGDDTLPNGNKFFTGTNSVFESSIIEFPCLAVKREYENNLWFKFTFISDSIPDNKDGWMIDDISYIDGMWICSGIDEKDLSASPFLVFPNPSSTETQILFQRPYNERFSAIIYDITGKEIIHSDNLMGNATLNCSDMHKGIYFVKINDGKGNALGVQKLVIH